MIEIWPDLVSGDIKVAFGDEEFSVNLAQAKFMIEQLKQASLIIERFDNVEDVCLGMWEDCPINY